MRRALPLTPLESNDLDANITLNVVMAYEDFEAGKHAKNIYDFLVANAAHEYLFSNQMWKFEVLSIPKIREIAAKDAAGADLVIISCHGHELSPEVRAWLELWLGEPNHAIALVALFAEPDLEETAEVRSYLAHVAMRGQMEFFAQPDEWPGHSRYQSSLPVPRNRAADETTLPILTTTAERDLSFSRWGINE